MGRARHQLVGHRIENVQEYVGVPQELAESRPVVNRAPGDVEAAPPQAIQVIDHSRAGIVMEHDTQMLSAVRISHEDPFP